MKKFKSLILVLPFVLFSCSSDDSSDSNDDDGNNPPQFAMTASINGVEFKANNPFGNNMFSNTNIFSYFPIEEYVLLQGRAGGVLGNPEINLWLKRSQLAVGTYSVSEDIFNPTTHTIDLIDNSNDEFEDTVEGTVIITEVNNNTKIVKGTFQFTTSDSPESANPIINYTITNGEFRYQYEEVN
jgi:hypothetical protein